MCGIAGIVSSRNASCFLEHISRMTDTLRHRGPDDEGFVFFGMDGETPHIFGGSDTPETVYQSAFSFSPKEDFARRVPEKSALVLGHRRLSILDLSPAGHQPMCNEDGTIWIVYNGEIYNFLELRKELELYGHRFVSHTDTEVILHAYEEWGEQCLAKFDGMWSFVIYDVRKNVLFGARDRFGVKPFYYHSTSEVFVFASEIKALVAMPFVPHAVNHEVAYEYIGLGVCEPYTEQGFFQDILELLPSHAFHYDLTTYTLNIWKYYTLEITNVWEPFNEKLCAQYVAQTHELVMNAVASHLQSDVPVGCNLSGGVDSSSIVCVVNRLLQQQHFEQVGDRQKVFTASYENDALDESKWAKLVIDYTNTTWFQTYPTANELWRDLEDLIYTEDFPFGTTSTYAEHRVMKLAREQGITVLLGGQGGDELFTGYTPYYSAFFVEMLRNRAFRDFVSEFRSLYNAPIDKKWLMSILPMHIVRNPLLRTMGIFSAGAWMYALRRRLSLAGFYCNREFAEIWSKKINWSKYKIPGSMNMALYDYMTRSSLKYQLRSEDRNSMRFSIESRPVFSDAIKLIETIFRTPSVYKIHNGWSKYLLRQAMADIVPEKILRRTDKIGFETPEQVWLVQLKEPLKAYFTPDVQEYIDCTRLFRDWERLVQFRSGADVKMLWRCVNFAIWKKVYHL